ncbi:MAG: EF-hand domain-containing protein [Ekhidna sp.]|nr:EF-hand domain-containing protein [Ekhidna sp.]
MLTELQISKLERFFYVLDYNRNGIIEKEDFIGIAENLCILWRIKEGEEKYNVIKKRFEDGWKHFDMFVNNNDGKANWDHWIRFAEEVIVKGDEAIFNHYVDEFVGEIFDNFDTDNDGYIDLDEYIDLLVGYRIEVRFAAKSFRKLDRNNDDLISRGELIRAVKEFFRSNDPDAPGNLLFGRALLSN